MARLLTLPPQDRKIVVYVEDSFSYIPLKGYLNALWKDHGISYQYVTSSSRDPLLEAPPPGATVWYVDRQLPRLMDDLECSVFVTTMPDLGQFHVARPKKGRTVYAFHSLNSTHTAYRTGAFDHYDVIMCTGPHHVSELRAMRGGITGLDEVGYFKLDLVRQEHEVYVGAKPDRPTVLLAPSWGKDNLLEAHGEAVIDSLLEAGFHVTVRPHPQFFHTLYPKGQDVMDALVGEYGETEQVEFEMDINTQESFYRSDLMVSDWSGAAYEYALGTYRPVLFIDTPPKIFNPDWEALTLPAFENVMRTKVGSIISGDRIETLGSVALSLVGDPKAESKRLRELSDRTVFNPGQSSSAGAQSIVDAI